MRIILAGVSESCPVGSEYRLERNNGPEAGAMFRAYVECAGWSTLANRTEEDGATIDRMDDGSWTRATLRAMRGDCLGFWGMLSEEDQAALSDAMGWANIGHNLWLTAQRHGAGFWDAGLESGLSDRVCKAARLFARDLRVGRRGAVHTS